MKQDEARIERIYALFDEYRQAYAAEWQRLERCERLIWASIGTTCRRATLESRARLRPCCNQQ